MRSILWLIILLLAARVFAAGTDDLALVPWPQHIQRMDGSFAVTPGTRVCADWHSRKTAAFFAQRLGVFTGHPLKAHRRISGNALPNSIVFTTRSANCSLGAEGYELDVTTKDVVICAPTQTGLFYGGQTLLQLLSPPQSRARQASGPPEMSGMDPRGTRADWQVPCVRITDWPRFPWRGLMLDVSRHFFNKAEVETILDDMALYKLNRFHWHLTDDQGWRIEIKQYPRLTQIGAWRGNPNVEPAAINAPDWTKPSPDKFGPDGRYGGFYTPQDIREVVAYAAARHIMVIPEIEMPGHSEAALAAYPQFSCFGGPYSTDNDLSIHDGIYDPSNEATFKFLDGVLDEVFKLFPTPYIHIGGDEVRRNYWDRSAACRALMRREHLNGEDELQSYFIKRMERFVHARGRILIGWSEILEGGLATNAVVMDWIGGGKAAAETGHDAIMTPIDYCYLDHYHKPDAPDIYTPLQKVYSFDPVPAGLPQRFQSRILGAEGVLWTEYVASLPQAERVIFPRECAIAEITWSPKNSRDWDRFKNRLDGLQSVGAIKRLLSQ